MKNVTEVDISYAAATIDCEGWVGIARGVGYNRKRVKYQRFNCTCRVGTTSKALADWLHATFEGGVYFRPSQRTKWKDQYIWTLGSDNLIAFLKAILPYLKIKQEQAKLALEYLDNFQTNDPQWRESMVQKMNDLNRKGKLVTTNTSGTSEKEVKIESELTGDRERALDVNQETTLAIA